MEATNFANRHEILGVGTHSSPISNHTPRRTDDITNNTVSPGPTLRENTGTRDFAHDPGNNVTSPIPNSKSEEARMNVARSTEIGDPNGRIPTAQDTHNQLNAAQSELAAAQRNEPSDASSHIVHGVPRTHMGDADAGVSTSERGHRNSNYAPGYEGAADAVRQKSYNADEHRPSLLAHEPVTPLSEVPPDLGNNTQQTSSNQGPGRIPGPSIGQKAKAPFAKIHGAGEVLRGNLAAAADSFTGDTAKQAKDEAIVRKGQEEFTHGRFDKAQTSRKVVGFFAWANGAGEVIRGRVNASIAKVIGEEETQKIEEETARRGKREMINQEFEPAPPPLPPRERRVSKRAEKKAKKRDKSSE
ncbi:hypothetical protein INS49_012870 [Diaporthe citri]|uniref:uncharacterized protein n=1 Tax=Diaporthe citri TaxID=83186 RepID=UPI001C81CEC2|nr:uncharacterized protein INS49_012870 [Diaporthe citri]KAG6359349.1 hypothetical protein INS49_012870 [Diaporthe citri]